MGILSRPIKLAVPYWISFFFLVLMIQTVFYYRSKLCFIFNKFLCLEKDWENVVIREMIFIFSEIFRFAFLSAAVPKVLTDIDKILHNSTHAEYLAIFIAYSTQKKRIRMILDDFFQAAFWQAKYTFTAATKDNLCMHSGVYISIFYMVLGCSIFLKYSTTFLKRNFAKLAFLFLGSSLYDTFSFWEIHYNDQPENVENLKKVREVMRTIQHLL